MISNPSVIDLRGDDVVVFPYCTFADGRVRDGLLRDDIKVNAVAQFVVSRCDGRRSWSQVIADVAQRYGISLEQSRADLWLFLESADARHLLRIRRRWSARMTPQALFERTLDLASLRVTRFEHRRYPPTMWGCLRACAWACRLPLVLAVATMPLLWWALVAQAEITTGTAMVGAVVPLAIVLAVVATIVAHELGHVLALPRSARTRADICAGNLRVLVRHPGSSASRDRVVALSGPVVGVTVSILVATIGWLAVPAFSTWGALPLIIAAGHALSLLPWSEDGRQLWRGAS